MHKLILTTLLIADLLHSAIIKDKQSFVIGIVSILLWLLLLTSAGKIFLP